MDFVPVFLTPNVSGVWLKALCGRHLMLVSNTATPTAINLLQGLVAQVEEPVVIKRLVSADRDILLAHVYLQEYGSKIESTVNCKHCKAKFDIDFSLPDLVNSRALQREKDAPANYSLENVGVFRLPTGEDELFALQSPHQVVERLLQQCVGAALPPEDSLLVQETMAGIAPMLQTSIISVCVECDGENEVMFDMQQFLLTRLQQEQQQLINEVHLLALNYHWSYNEIIDLPVKLIHRYATQLRA